MPKAVDKGAGPEGALRTGPTGGGARSVVACTFVTLDGLMVGPNEDISWVEAGFDPELQADIAVDMSQRYDLFIFGRVTYDIFAQYWPTAVPYEEGDEVRPSEGKENPRIIRALNDTTKLVFSRTLSIPEWDNTQVVADGLEEEIRRRKYEPGRDISIQGSASIVQALARADLIDEYRLYLHPVLLGGGKRLYAAGAGRQDFELVHQKTYANGVIATSYRRK